MMTPLLKDGLLSTLVEWDKWLFLKINGDWSNNFFDAVFPFWRHSDTWLPLYFFLFLFMVINFGWRSLPWMLALGVTAGLCDQISSTFVKDVFDRVRPCREPSLEGQVVLRVIHCATNGSFTSSHATNHFGAATFIFFTTPLIFRQWRWLFYAWAATICYAQVYVGVHYPTDVMGGAVLGTAIGYLLARLFNQQPQFSYFTREKIKL